VLLGWSGPAVLAGYACAVRARSALLAVARERTPSVPAGLLTARDARNPSLPLRRMTRR
jgi:hypothetical protein